MNYLVLLLINIWIKEKFLKGLEWIKWAARGYAVNDAR